MNPDDRSWTQVGIPCQKHKAHRHTKSIQGSFPASNSCFAHVHIDIVGPLPSYDNHQYILTMIDRFTRWPAAHPLRHTSAKCVAKNFVKHWFANFGVHIRGAYDKFPDFFRMGTFIDSANMKL